MLNRFILATCIVKMRASHAGEVGLMYCFCRGLCLFVCLRTLTGELLIRNVCNLVEICAMVPPKMIRFR